VDRREIDQKKKRGGGGIKTDRERGKRERKELFIPKKGEWLKLQMMGHAKSTQREGGERMAGNRVPKRGRKFATKKAG